MDLSTFINAALAAGGGGGVVGMLVLAMYRHNLKKEQEERDADRCERSRLSDKLERLEKDQVAELKRELDEHIGKDRSQEILTKLDSISGAVCKLTDSTSRALERSASQEAKIAAHDIWLANLNNSVDGITGNHHRPTRGQKI